jgi:hypothetical protein
MRKEGRTWVLDEVRLGDRKWEKVDRIVDSLEANRTSETVQKMGQLASAIKGYTYKNGAAPEVEDFRALIDLLSPSFLDTVIRIDAWSNPFSYRNSGLLAYELRSAGVDGIFETEDDLVIGEQ